MVSTEDNNIVVNMVEDALIVIGCRCNEHHQPATCTKELHLIKLLFVPFNQGDILLPLGSLIWWFSNNTN